MTNGVKSVAHRAIQITPKCEPGFYPTCLDLKKFQYILNFSETKQRAFIAQMNKIDLGREYDFSSNFHNTLFEFLSSVDNRPIYNKIASFIQKKQRMLTVPSAFTWYVSTRWRRSGDSESYKGFCNALNPKGKKTPQIESAVDWLVENEELEYAAECLWAFSGLGDDKDGQHEALIRKCGEKYGELEELVKPMLALLNERQSKRREEQSTERMPLRNLVSELKQQVGALDESYPLLEEIHQVQITCASLLTELELLAEKKADLAPLAEAIRRIEQIENIQWVLVSTDNLIANLERPGLVVESKSVAQLTAELNERFNLLELSNSTCTEISGEIHSTKRPPPGVLKDLTEKLNREAETFSQNGEDAQGLICEAFLKFGLNENEIRLSESQAEEHGTPGDESQEIGVEVPQIQVKELSEDELAEQPIQEPEIEREFGLTDDPEEIPYESAEEWKSGSEPITVGAEESSDTLVGIDKTENDEKESPEVPTLEARLGRLLEAGKFDVAYWLCCAADVVEEQTCVNSSLLGAIAASLSPRKGLTNHPKLKGLLSDLTAQVELNSSERILSAVALISSAVLSSEIDRPQNQLFSLASQKRESGLHDLDELEQFVIENVIRRFWVPQKTNVDTDISPQPSEVQILELVSEAEQFLSNLPKVRFNYQPARTALLELFSDGSELRQILRLVIAGKFDDKSIRHMGQLLESVDSPSIIANLDAYTSLKANQLQGSARGQLKGKLEKAFDIGARWLVIAKQKESGTVGGKNTQLDGKLRTLLQKCIESLHKSSKGTTIHHQAQKGTSLVIRYVLNVLSGEQTGLKCHLDHALTRIACLELDAEFQLLDSEAAAMLGLIDLSDDDPQFVIDKCLERHEFPRAVYVAKSAEDADSLVRMILRRKHEYVELLQGASEQAVEDVEDANLLGLVSDAAEQEEGMNRTELLGNITDAQLILESSIQSDEVDVREAKLLLEDVTGFVNEVRSKRRLDLRNQISESLDKLPSTAEGQQDRKYIEEEMHSFLEANDNVAIAELYERLTTALRDHDSVVRVERGGDPRVKEFLEQYEFLETLQNSKYQEIEKAIKQQVNIGPLLFANRDKSHLGRADLAIKAWKNLRQQNSFSQNAALLISSVEDLLALIGLRTAENKLLVGKEGNADLALLRLQNPSGARLCPVPAFGSDLNGVLDIFVLRTMRPFSQVIDELKRLHATRAGVLVIHLIPLTKKQRLNIRDLCVRGNCTFAILDFPLLAYLCSADDPLKAFYEVTLPLLWHQPYLKAGENVSREMFVGRESQIRDLMSPQGSCIVFGGRQLGKSALLRHIAIEHHKPKMGIYVAYRDIDSLGSPLQKNDDMEREFWLRISQELSHVGFMTEQEQDSRSGGKVNRSNAHNKLPKLIRERLSEDESLRLIILLDEADKLLNLDAKIDFRLVRSIRAEMAATNRRFKVVFTGLRSVQLFNNAKNQPFAHLGNAIVIEPLPPRDAQDLVQRPLKALGFTFDESSLVLRILSQANYHPGLVQIFCYRLLENLYKNKNQETATQVITRQDIYKIERDSDFKDDIRERFNLTLKLDDRYKVLTDALVMRNAATAKLKVSQFKEIGVEWWPQVFESMDTQQMRGLLDEMAGLGVLLQESENGIPVYRLRSPNLLRLLGSKNDIESEMIGFMEKSAPTQMNPQNYHKRDKTQNTFGPLTIEQHSQITESEAPFKITFVCGSSALGIRLVSKEIELLLGELSEYNKKWSEIKVPPAALTGGVKRLTGFIREKMKSTKRDHLFYICHLSELPSDLDLSSLIHAFLEGPGHACQHRSQGQVFLIADEDMIWKIMNDADLARQISNEPRIEQIFLKRWSDGAISHALDQLDFKVKSLNGEEIFRETRGIHSVVQCLLAQLKKGLKPAIENDVKMLASNAITAVKNNSESEGLEIESEELKILISELFGFVGNNASDAQIDWQTFIDLSVEEGPQWKNEFLSNEGENFRKWVQAIGVAGPLDRNGSLSVAAFSQQFVH